MKAYHRFTTNRYGDLLLHLRDEKEREISKPIVVYRWPNVPKDFSMYDPPVVAAARRQAEDLAKALELERRWNQFAS